MKRSAFLELLDEEQTIRKGGPGVFRDKKELFEMLDARKALMEKAKNCLDRGELTQQQCDQLIALTRKNIGV